MNVSDENIKTMIYIIRGQRVMLDSDLARLYGVETKILNQAVRRHLKRFPEDFMFECSINDLGGLRSQIVTANRTTSWNFKRRVTPLMFTENGVAMLSSVLNSDHAIEVNIAIMRAFMKGRSCAAIENKLENRVNKLESGTNKLFKIVFERLDGIEEQVTPKLPAHRKKIGLKN